MNARQTNILDILSNQNRISVAELSAALEVSEVTIRKDLSLLEKKGLLQREHGFAAMVESAEKSPCGCPALQAWPCHDVPGGG